MGAAERAVGWLARSALKLAALACLATLAIVCYAVAMRYFVGRPQSWADVVASWLVVATVMLATAEAQRRGDHIGVDLLLERSGPAWRRRLMAAGAAAVLAMALVLTREGWEMIAFSRMVGIVSDTFPDVEMWMVQSLVPLGAALLALVALVQLGAWLSGREPLGLEQKRDGFTE